jgi:hypothetical protein
MLTFLCCPVINNCNPACMRCFEPLVECLPPLFNFCACIVCSMFEVIMRHTWYNSFCSGVQPRQRTSIFSISSIFRYKFLAVNCFGKMFHVQWKGDDITIRVEQVIKTVLAIIWGLVITKNSSIIQVHAYHNVVIWSIMSDCT